MKCKLILFATACLSCLLASTAATKELIIGGVAGATLSLDGETVVIQSQQGHVVKTIPAHHEVVIQHKPISLVPLATIPSHSLTDRVARLWGGISDSIGSKIRAVGDFFRPPPRVILLNKPTKNPCLQPVLIDIVAGIPQYRFIPILEGCDKS